MPMDNINSYVKRYIELMKQFSGNPDFVELLNLSSFVFNMTRIENKVDGNNECYDNAFDMMLYQLSKLSDTSKI